MWFPDVLLQNRSSLFWWSGHRETPFYKTCPSLLGRIPCIASFPMEFNRFQMFWMMPEAQESLVTAVIFKKITEGAFAHFLDSTPSSRQMGKWHGKICSKRKMPAQEVYQWIHKTTLNSLVFQLKENRHRPLYATQGISFIFVFK